MACYHPLLAYKLDGKVTFNKPFVHAKGFNLPCGQCIGCRLEYSRQWAVRLVHEAQMHNNNSFITLTFDDENLYQRDNPYSLDVGEFQKFMKRFRKGKGKNVRFFHCGEYGDKNKRPHYHAIIFGWDFPDKTLWSVRDGVQLYVSEELQNLWPYGFSTIGEVTFQSCAYVARYVMKKMKGEAAEDYYKTVDPHTGEVLDIKPEYCTMSRRPGIGAAWIEKYKNDVYPNDYVVINGKEVRPPRYYDNILSEEELEQLKKKRQENKILIDRYDENMDRLWVQEEVKMRKLEKLVRNL
jgi:hypothetical protein